MLVVVEIVIFLLQEVLGWVVQVVAELIQDLDQQEILPQQIHLKEMQEGIQYLELVVVEEVEL